MKWIAIWIDTDLEITVEKQQQINKIRLDKNNTLWLINVKSKGKKIKVG